MRKRAVPAARDDENKIRSTRPISFDDAISNAAELSAPEYERQRRMIAKGLGIRTIVLDRMVDAERPKVTATAHQGQALDFPEVEAHEKPVDGFALLNEIAELFLRHIVLSVQAATGLALWSVWTYIVDAFTVAPLLGLASATKRCGKTRTLGLVKRIVARPLAASNISPAAVYRAIEKWRPTLLIDEADSFLKDNEQLRGVLNSGHTRDSAFVIRSEGDDHEPRIFSTWGAKLWAAIGTLQPTLMDRSIVVVLKRRAMGEVFAERLPADSYFEELRSRIVRWTNDHREELCNLHRRCRDSLDDRAADNWWPLLAIASAAGGDWEERASRAAASLSGETEDSQEIAIALLRDILRAFEDSGAAEMHSEDLLRSLVAMPESAWATWHHGRPMTAKALANLLRPFGIRSQQIKIESVNRNGYMRSQFIGEWDRYCVSSTESTPSQTRGLSARTHGLLEYTSRGYESGGNARQIKAVERVDDTAVHSPLRFTKGGKLCGRCRGLGLVTVVDGELVCKSCLGDDGSATEAGPGFASEKKIDSPSAERSRSSKGAAT